jgi:HEAT repeats
MEGITMLTRKNLVVALAILGLLGGIAWWQRKPLLARHYVQRLGQADEANRESWAASVIALDEAVVPSLLAALESADNKTCANLEFALVGLVRNWGPDDARSQALLEQVALHFGSLNEGAKNSVLQIPIVLLNKTPEKRNLPPLVTRLAGDLLSAAAEAKGLRVSVLRLAGALVEQVPHGQWLDLCRELAVKGLGASDVEARVAAIQLVLRPALRQENDLLAKVVPLLKDSVPSVRKTALLALGPAKDLISDDDLLPLLHDADDEVQNLCELALRSRGLQENHILLARLISDEQPSARLQVLEHLREATDLEPGVWLQLLCHDSSPAVRAAAVRAVASQPQVDLRNCLHEMAQQDPSPTVRQLAGHYLNRSRPKTDD